MNIYTLKFSSKNKKSLKNAILLFYKYFSLDSSIIKKYSSKKTIKKVVTLLKSPHVNKSAQEQFESNTFSKQLTLYSPKKLKYLFFIKKIQESLFSDVKLKISFYIKVKSCLKPKVFKIKLSNNILTKTIISQTKDLKNTKQLKKIKNINTNNLKTTLKNLDSFGEINIRNKK